MAAAYLLGLFFVLGFVHGGPFNAQPAIIEDLRDAEFSSSRIVAGWPAAEGQIPYQGSLRMVNNAGGVSSCGCSLIHHQWVLTAAHCVANRNNFVLRFGVTNLTRPEYIIESQGKHIHPEYDEVRAGVQTADIALIELNNFIPYSANVQPSRLMNSAQKNVNYHNVTMIVSGYGRTDDLWNGGTASEILLWVLQRGVSNEECLRWYVGSTVIREQTICAGYYNNTSQSSCQGDSGGPLTIVDTDGLRTQVGIVSFGSTAGCNSPFPSGYVRPGHYHDWFTNVTGIDFDWVSDDTPDESTDEPETEETTDEPEYEESSEESDEEDSSSSEENDVDAPSEEDEEDQVNIIW